MAMIAANDSLELIRGLSDELGLSVREVGESLGIHTRTLLRRQESGRLEEAELLKAQMVAEACEFATTALGDAGAAKGWLFSELPALGFERPVDLLTNIRGYERVKSLLGQIVFGSY